MKKLNNLIGKDCLHGSPGIPVKEKVTAIDLNIVKEKATIHFESGCSTEMPIETLDKIADEWQDGYAEAVYNPWKCSTTNRSGMLEQIVFH
jgi:hypothetical protein